MCGRYSLATPADELIETFDVPGPTFEHEARYNIAPGQDAPVVAEDSRGRRIGLLRWGFVPARSDEAGSGFVNARGESVGQTPSFRDAFRRRRCLVPADGFYEWRREGNARIPYWFHPPGGGVLAMAGIWEHWSRPGHEDRWSFAVLPVEASPDVRAVHDRMPLLLPRAAWDAWLDRSTGPDAL
ncbi:MAG TPA: SOS response-associated peptidase, partial [Longimicrobiales bacterium]|nr:SOS response-associated peptidase [Longimicrobiales bacterium]